VHWLSQKLETCQRVVWTSVWSIPYARELCSRNCIVKTSETSITWRASCYAAGTDKLDAVDVPDRLLKRAVMVNSVHNRHVEYLLTTDVHSQWWLSISRELCVIIKSHAQINWYFRCIIVSLKLCKEYWNIAIIQNTSLTPNEELNILIYWTPSYDIIYRSYTPLKWSVFGPPCIYMGSQSL